MVARWNCITRLWCLRLRRVCVQLVEALVRYLFGNQCCLGLLMRSSLSIFCVILYTYAVRNSRFPLHGMDVKFLTLLLWKSVIHISYNYQGYTYNQLWTFEILTSWRSLLPYCHTRRIGRIIFTVHNELVTHAVMTNWQTTGCTSWILNSWSNCWSLYYE